MPVSVAAVMQHCRNYFESGYIDGTFLITGNELQGVSNARYVYISGSECHDGVWNFDKGLLTGRDVSDLWDEEFAGRVWLLSPPPEFLDACQQIAAYEEKNPIGAPVQEKFGEYSYMRNMRSGQSTSWPAIFANVLTPYRRMYTEVK